MIPTQKKLENSSSVGPEDECVDSGGGLGVAIRTEAQGEEDGEVRRARGNIGDSGGIDGEIRRRTSEAGKSSGAGRCRRPRKKGLLPRRSPEPSRNGSQESN